MIIKRTDIFRKWFIGLKDVTTITIIRKRIDTIERDGYFGNYKQIAKHLYELKFYIGNGYRVYFTIQKNVVVLLICGGTKDTQKRDIKKAKEILKYMLEEYNEK